MSAATISVIDILLVSTRLTDLPKLGHNIHRDSFGRAPRYSLAA
jgi:hypothetical protein